MLINTFSHKYLVLENAIVIIMLEFSKKALDGRKYVLY